MFGEQDEVNNNINMRDIIKICTCLPEGTIIIRSNTKESHFPTQNNTTNFKERHAIACFLTYCRLHLAPTTTAEKTAKMTHMNRIMHHRAIPSMNVMHDVDHEYVSFSASS
jgi:hypothetical protein